MIVLLAHVSNYFDLHVHTGQLWVKIFHIGGINVDKCIFKGGGGQNYNGFYTATSYAIWKMDITSFFVTKFYIYMFYGFFQINEIVEIMFCFYLWP